MPQQTIIQMLAGAKKVIRQSAEVIKESGANYIEENVIKGKYVTREEYDQLQKLVLQLQKELSEMKSQ